MKKLLLSAALSCASFAFTTTAWAGVVTEETPDGNGYIIVTKTVTDQTTNMAAPNADENKTFTYTDAQGVTFALTSPVEMSYGGATVLLWTGQGLKLFENVQGQRQKVDFTWNMANADITVSSITLNTRIFAAGTAYVAINEDATEDNGTAINIGGALSGLTDNQNSNNKDVTYTGTLQNGTFFSYYQAERVGSLYDNIGGAYINTIKVDYVLTYHLLDLAELNSALNDATQWYNTLNADSKATAEGSALGAAIDEANTFISENSGAIDLENGKTPADVAKLIEKLRATAFNANLVDESDMTNFIKNNSFETNSLTGWTTTTSGGNSNDTKVHENAGDHVTDLTDGNYLFNTYRQGSTNANGTNAVNHNYYYGYPISQTITGLPNGTYEVSALLYSWDGFDTVDGVATVTPNKTYLTINGEKVAEVTNSTLNTFEEASAIVEVTDGTLTIGAVGGQKTVQGTKGRSIIFVLPNPTDGDVFTYNTWYRADNFQLKLIKADTYHLNEAVDYVKPEGERKEVVLKKDMKAGKFSAVCLPFNYTPSDWTVYTLAGEEEQNNGSTLAITLESVTGELTAGHPYFVCPASDYETITANDVTLIDEPATVDSHMPLVGVFEATPLNAGDIYISTTADEMTFKYLKEGASATLKPYRAYFKLTDGVSASTFRINTEGADVTSILNVISEKQNEGIYDLNGRRTNALKAGVYVVNGKKVIIK